MTSKFGSQTSNYALYWWVFLIILATTSIQHCSAQNMPVPENIQAALLPKVLKFNSNFSDKNPIRLLLVYDNISQKSKDLMIQDLDQSFDIKAIKLEELYTSIKNTDIVYFMPGLQLAAEICKEHKVLSVSGISQYAENGNVSLAFGLLNNKPKIFINLTSMEQEGQTISSEILRISKVYH